MENTTKPENEPVENAVSDYHDQARMLDLETMENGVKKARNALFLTAGLVLLGEILGIVRAGIEPNALVIGIIAVEVGILIALAFWTKKKPYTAIVAGLIVFILYWVLGVVVNTMADGSGTSIASALFGGIIIKVVILVTLIRALSNAKELQQLKSEQGL